MGGIWVAWVRPIDSAQAASRRDLPQGSLLCLLSASSATVRSIPLLVQGDIGGIAGLTFALLVLLGKLLVSVAKGGGALLKRLSVACVAIFDQVANAVARPIAIGARVLSWLMLEDFFEDVEVVADLE